MDLLPETLPLVERIAKQCGYKLCHIQSRTGYRIYNSNNGAAGIDLHEVDMYIRNKGEADTADFLIKEKFK